ncbi:hypothetical protein GCM10027597_47850 [Saccharopolyspora tripterygii]
MLVLLGRGGRGEHHPRGGPVVGVVLLVPVVAGVAVFEGVDALAERVDLLGQPADDLGERAELLVQLLGVGRIVLAGLVRCGFTTAAVRGDVVLAHSGLTSW